MFNISFLVYIFSHSWANYKQVLDSTQVLSRVRAPKSGDPSQATETVHQSETTLVKIKFS